MAADLAAHAADDEHALPAAGASSGEVVEEEEAKKKKNSILEESSFERARACSVPCDPVLAAQRVPCTYCWDVQRRTFVPTRKEIFFPNRE